MRDPDLVACRVTVVAILGGTVAAVLATGLGDAFVQAFMRSVTTVVAFLLLGLGLVVLVAIAPLLLLVASCIMRFTR